LIAVGIELCEMDAAALNHHELASRRALHEGGLGARQGSRSDGWRSF
jgi:hypothetical protein